MKKLTTLLFALFGLFLAGCAEVIGKPGALVLEQTSETADVVQRGIEKANEQAKLVLDRRLSREAQNRVYAQELQRKLAEQDRQTAESYIERACRIAPGVSVELPITAAKVIAHCPEPPPTDTAADVE